MELEHCFELFDLDRNCSPEQAKQAYRDLVHVWHPDRFGDNLRLRQKAETKLKEINSAYDQIMKAIGSYPPVVTRQTDTAVRHNAPIDFCGSGRPASGAKPSATEEKPPPKFEEAVRPTHYRPRRSVGVSLGTYIMIGFVALMVAMTAIILNLLSKFDPLSTNGSMPASSELRKIIRDFEKPLPDSQSSARAGSFGLSSGDAESSAIDETPREPKQYYEIHLKSGMVILTDQWWEDEDMIMYRINHGTMGIERRNVERIIRQ